MEEQIIDYAIIESVNSVTVIRDVKSKLKDGWELYQGLQVSRGSSGTLFAQAMVKFGPIGVEDAPSFGYSKDKR